MLVTKRNLLAIIIASLVLISTAVVANLPSTKNTDQNDILPSQLGELNKDPDFYSNSKDAESPIKDPITARSFIVGDIDTGEIYLDRNSTLVLPIASMSKLVTAMATIDFLDASTTVYISEQNLNVASDTSMLNLNEKFTVKELLYPLLLNSSNIAAEAIASSTERKKFLELMTGYAWEIGMPSTRFADPSGISPQNASSAKDFFALAQYLYKSKPSVLAITRNERIFSATTTDHMAHNFVNIHPFVKDPRFIGGKTGHTPYAGDTMLTILRIGNRPIAIIVLGSQPGMRAADTRMLIAMYEDLKKSIENRN